MKKVLSNDFVYQLVALVLALIVVHLVYVTVIRPNADAILGAQADRVAQGEAFVPDRSTRSASGACSRSASSTSPRA